MSEVLKGVRVVDLTRGPAGGLATMIMADFGAEVLVKMSRHATVPINSPQPRCGAGVSAI